MAYYNEIFKEENGELIHLGSCTGSDTPHYFEDVKNLEDWNFQIEELTKENGFWPHSEKHPFPWKSYKTSDHLIVLRPTHRKWFEFWKPTHQVWVSADKFSVKGENKCDFIKIDKWQGDSDYDSQDLIILDLPLLNK